MTRVGMLNMKSPLRERQKHYENTLQFSMGTGEGYLEHGVLAAAVDAAQFASLTGALWTAEPKQPVMPADDGLGPDRVEREKFLDETKTYSRWVKGKRDTYSYLIKPFGENEMLIDMCKPANDKRHGALVPLVISLAAYKKNFLQPTSAEIKIEVKALEGMKFDRTNASNSMEEFVTEYRYRSCNLVQLNVIIPEFTLVSNFINSVGGLGGYYKRGLEKFGDLALNEQTFDKLVSEVLLDNKRLINVEAHATGFAAAATTSESEEGLLRAQEIADQVQRLVDEKMEAIAAAFPALAAAVTAAAKGQQQSTQPQRPPRGKGQGMGAATGGGGAVDLNAPIPVLSYCWSCGPNPWHNGSACPDKEKGHIAQATAANPQGGRRRRCSVANRVKFPHPT